MIPRRTTRAEFLVPTGARLLITSKALLRMKDAAEPYYSDLAQAARKLMEFAKRLPGAEG
jgi:hypothetical protein